MPSQQGAVKLFSAIPGNNAPEELLYCFQKALVEGLELHLTKIQQSLKCEYPLLIQKIEGLDIHKRFSPALFNIYYLLKEGYLKKDLHAIFDTLQLFKNLSLEKMYAVERIYSSILSEEWEGGILEELRHHSTEDAVGDPKSIQMFPLVHWKDPDFYTLAISEAEALIQKYDPFFWKEYTTYVSRIKLYLGKVIQSTTSGRFFGAIYLRLPHPGENPLLFNLEFLVHETSHLHLFAMMGEDPAVLNAPEEKFDSPLRKDLRPMIGVFHATFVLARIVRFYRFLTESETFPEAIPLLKKTEMQFFQGLKTIEEHARLSDQGESILKSMTACAFATTRSVV